MKSIKVKFPMYIFISDLLSNHLINVNEIEWEKKIGSVYLSILRNLEIEKSFLLIDFIVKWNFFNFNFNIVNFKTNGSWLFLFVGLNIFLFFDTILFGLFGIIEVIEVKQTGRGKNL
uniref:hypothetical protein n=1 Tax=Hydrocytium acuminatum TaxID=1745963 RepID=UPI002A814A36|nr:hypothetical protein UYM18_pgp022 [Hydrocytium acuminatum]WOR09594.1 hypothetical protein [Hydrocytium acuminatum]